MNAITIDQEINTGNEETAREQTLRAQLSRC